MKAWENHLKRNQSIIDDLFQGMVRKPMFFKDTFSSTDHYLPQKYRFLAPENDSWCVFWIKYVP